METILQPVYYIKKLPALQSGSFKILVDSYDLITGIGNSLCLGLVCHTILYGNDSLLFLKAYGNCRYACCLL